jgi:hypothetical protein
MGILDFDCRLGDAGIAATCGVAATARDGIGLPGQGVDDSWVVGLAGVVSGLIGR